MAASNLKQFIRLDFLTSNMWAEKGLNTVFLAVIILITVLFRSLLPVVGMLMFILNSYVTDIFIKSEYHNMDALYITLNVSRKTVVKGRYIFALIMLFGGVLATFTMLGAGLLAENLLNINLNASTAILMALGMTAVQIVTQAVQLPITMKRGMKSGSNVFIQLPLLVMILLVGFAVSFFGNDGVASLIETVSEGALAWILPVAVVVVLCAVVYASYRVAVKVYSDREF
jgi:hypothetical protein